MKVDRYTHTAICVLFAIILSVEERFFCVFYSLKSIISLSCLLLRTSIRKIIERKKVTQSRSLVHIFSNRWCSLNACVWSTGELLVFWIKCPIISNNKISIYRVINEHEKVIIIRVSETKKEEEEYSMINITWFGQDTADSCLFFFLFSCSRI